MIKEEHSIWQPGIHFFWLIIFLSACGSPPLAQPETLTSPTPPETPVTSRSILLPTTTAPQATGPASTEADLTSSPPPTTTPVPATPTSVTTTQSISLITNTPTSFPVSRLSPTPRPTATPTSTFEPLSDKPIGGYVFGQPEEIVGLNNSVIRGWSPHSTEEMIVAGGDFIDIVNIQTGEKQRLFAWSPLTHNKTTSLTWLPGAQQSALILFNMETNQYELWVNKSRQTPATKPTLTNVSHSFIPVGSEFGIYDLDRQVLVSSSNQRRNLPVEELSLPTTSDKADSLPYHITQSGDWVAYYNRDNFALINLTTHETRNISFTDEQGRSLSAWGGQWSHDGSRFAVLLSHRDPILTFMDLYVYDLANDRLQKVQTAFTHYIDSVTWAPNNRHVVVNAIIGQAEYRTSTGDTIVSDKNALFLVDTMTMKHSPIPIHSPDTASSIGQVLWSPNEKYLVARYRFYQGGAPVYRLEVTLP